LAFSVNLSLLLLLPFVVVWKVDGGGYIAAISSRVFLFAGSN
jgi:hypothetical protein